MWADFELESECGCDEGIVCVAHPRDVAFPDEQWAKGGTDDDNADE